MIKISVKPSRLLDWCNDDDSGKFTVPDSPSQLAGHINDTAADNKLFNWTWWRISQWIEYLDELDLDQIPDGSTYGKVKVDDLTSNRVDFDKLDGVSTTKTEVNQLNTSGAVLADFTKLHSLTPSAADLNHLLGADGNGLVAADITKLANIDASAAEINQLDGVTVGGNSSGDILTTDDTQTITGKSISASQVNSGILDAARIPNIDASKITTGSLDINGTSRYIKLDGDDSNPCQLQCYGSSYNGIQISCNAAGSSAIIGPSANNVVSLTIGHTVSRYSSVTTYGPNGGMIVGDDIVKPTETDGSVDFGDSTNYWGNGYFDDIFVSTGDISIKDALTCDGTVGRVLRKSRITIQAGSVSGIKCTGTSLWNGDAIAVGDDIDKGDTVGYWSLDAGSGGIITIDSTGITGNCVAVLSIDIGNNYTAKDLICYANQQSNDIVIVFAEVSVGGNPDLTAIVPGTSGIMLEITYVTSA